MRCLPGLTRLAFVASTLAATAALADTNQSSDPGVPSVAATRLAVPTPIEMFAAPHAQISGTIYLERCRNGCIIYQGMNDALNRSSSIPETPGPHNITEYQNGMRDTGAAADAEWAMVVTCMREVYSPFNVKVTDVKPLSGTYHMAVIAGLPSELGFTSPDILGVAPLANDCSPQDNVISFSFANAHTQTETLARVNNICWTAAQESAHAFGLDHEFEFTLDKRSACNDPMTYRTDCGGQKFFRNASASCGETAARPCRCGGSQNSHLELLDVFGAGQSLIAPPTAAITTPTAAETMLGSFVAASAGSRRGVVKVQLIINGFKWAEVKGAPFGLNGQQNPAPYGLSVPATLPSSIVDVKVRAFDDLGAYTDSDLLTLTKGGPCVTADTCAKGQKCEQGRCFWDPAVGELGDACEYPQYCVSGICRGTAKQQICTQDCVPGVEDACPDGFACVPTEPNTGICFFHDGGCCSTSRGGTPWAPIAFATLTLGLLVRPWRRREPRAADR